MTEVLAVMLAGGVGERLYPLTKEVAKPAVPFGGIYRIIDITLSNCINAGLRKIYILTQYKAITLNRHIRRTWNIVSPELGEFIEILPPAKRISEDWYLGTANAVHQNSQSVAVEGLPFTLVLSADHVYKMNYQHMLDWHVEHGADVTVATTQVNPADAHHFGIVDIDAGCRIRGFEEKPKHRQPVRSRFNPEMCSASMGIYLFNTATLLEELEADNALEGSSHDFGKDVLPRMIEGGRKVQAYDFVDENRTDIRYWRDIGTLDAFYEANMDLVSVSPVFNLYDDKWPIRSAQWTYPPAKFVFAEEGRRMGVGVNSMVCAGCIISGGRVVNSILSPGVRVNSYSEVEFSILFPHVNIGRHSRIRRAIIDTDVTVEEHTEIGFDPEADQRAGHFVTESGIVIVHGDSPNVQRRNGGERQDHFLEASG
jgi:glucose-1-phosphate adenylyltransferase